MGAQGATSRRLAAMTLVVAATVTGCVTPTARQTGPGQSGAVPVPAEGAYFGTQLSASLPRRRARLVDLERAIGRRFAVDHVYYRWDEPFPSGYDRWTVRQGRLLFLNWTTRRTRGGPVTFADITAGRYDHVITARAKRLAELGVPVLMGFGHEPGALVGDPPGRSGTPEEYVAAWRHIAQVFAAADAPVSWVWTLTSYAFRQGTADSFYPGDDVVDWVGADGYVNVDCPWLRVGWSSWTELFARAEEFAADHGKPLVVAEFGLREDPADPDRKARWLRDSLSQMEEMPYLKAVVSFNSTQACSAPIWSSDAAVAAYREVGASAYFRPDLAGQLASGR